MSVLMAVMAVAAVLLLRRKLRADQEASDVQRGVPSQMVMPTLNPLDGAPPPTPRISGGYKPGTELKHFASAAVDDYTAAAALGNLTLRQQHQMSKTKPQMERRGSSGSKASTSAEAASDAV